MLTIFSVPKAFKGHIGVIQRNAVQSWTLLRPRPEIILFGKDEGTAECAWEFGVRYEPEITTNQYGTPLLNDMFRRAESAASHPWIWYVNADILLLANFMHAFKQVSQRLQKFLLVTERINMDVREPIQFSASWEEHYLRLSREEGVRWGPTGIDVFAYPRGFYTRVPDFGLGRLWFDQWLIKAARQMRAPVVDASLVAPVFHQNHDYNHVPGGAEWVWKGKEAEHNLALYGEKPHAYTLLDVTHELLPDGSLRRVRFRRQRAAVNEFLRKTLLEPTKNIRHRLGLRRGPSRQDAAAKNVTQ
jgi:hypothetical protein